MGNQIYRVVDDVAHGMAANAVAAKWANAAKELGPLVKPGCWAQVVDVLERYWPPDVEIRELAEYAMREA